jgi:hypothetical protein
MQSPDRAWELLESPNNIRDHAAIFHHGSSGSYLFYSMLDGHPEVIGLPIINPPQHVTKIIFWRMRELLENSGDLTFGKVADILGECFKSTELPWQDRESEFRALVGWGLRCLVEKNEDLTLGFLFRLFVVSVANLYGLAIGSSNPVLVWNEHNPGPDALFNVILLKEMLPGIKLVTVVRYPEKSADAHFDRYHRYFLEGIKHRITFQYFDQRTITRLFLDSFVDNHILYGDNASVVRFEDIHNSTRAVMAGVAQWLGLRWDDCLLESTSWRSPWVYEQRFSGTRKVLEAELELKHFDRLDRARLRYFLGPEYRRWGYAESKGKSLVPGSIWRGISGLIPFRTHRVRFRSFLQELRAEKSHDEIKATQKIPKWRRVFEELRLLWRSHRRLQANLFAAHKRHAASQNKIAPVIYGEEAGYHLEKLHVVCDQTALPSDVPSPPILAARNLADHRLLVKYVTDNSWESRSIAFPNARAEALDGLLDTLLANCIQRLWGEACVFRRNMSVREIPAIAVYGGGDGSAAIIEMFRRHLGISIHRILNDKEGFDKSGRPILAYGDVGSAEKATWIVLIANDYWKASVSNWEDVAINLKHSGFSNVYNASPLMWGVLF